MTMLKYNLSEAKAHFSAVMEAVEAGNAVTLCKRNRPIATLEPIHTEPVSGETHHHTRIGWAKNTVVLHGDPTEPAWPESDWEMLS